MAQAQAKRTIEAQQFVLRDAEGRPRIMIGTPRFAGAAVDLRADDPAIWISGTDGIDRAVLTMDGLTFADAGKGNLGSAVK